MTMTRESAFDLLGAEVSESHEIGRRVTAAGLKVRLRQRTEQEFDEKQLGYPTFRAFLRDAEAHGRVSLHAGAVDIFVTPPGLKPPEQQAATDARTASSDGGGATERIRSHLWRAFVDWTPGTQRFYDRQDHHAFSLPARPSPREQGEQLARREALANEPHRFIKIDPIPFEKQLGWMHDFANAQQSPIKEQLQLALATNRPARDFTAQVRAAPALYNSWHLALVGEVAGVIDRWARTHAVQVDVFEPQLTPLTDAGRKRQSGVKPRQSELRAILHRAIDRMPEHELAAIVLPVGYLLEPSTNS